MEKLSDKHKIIREQIFPIEIDIAPYIKDHTFAGKTVIPAVELCQILSNHLKIHEPELNNRVLYNAVFGKFIDINESNKIQALNKIESYDNGVTVSRLLTKTKLIKSGITRTNENVVIQFKKDTPVFNYLTYDLASALEGICMRVSDSQIYNELVPFGPSYQNLTGTLYVAESGAITYIKAPEYKMEGPLGSPFVFDAALHAASVWAQTYFGITAFPVEFEQRVIINPSIPGNKYFTRIIPKQSETGIFIFDIWIYDLRGILCEAGFNVKLRDVNKGKLKPPVWIIRKKDNSLNDITSRCDAISIIELDTISSFAEKTLSDTEVKRFGPMKEKRRQSYLGARIACKYLSRKLSKENCIIPANQITTIQNKIYPSCPVPGAGKQYNCSVSHDSRFAAAAASHKYIGIDIEEISETVVKAGHIYMNEQEKDLVNSSNMDKKEASLRIWSIKEAVTKALDLELTSSWKNVQVINISHNLSTFLINNVEINAYHSTIDNHLFTLVEFEK